MQYDGAVEARAQGFTLVCPGYRGAIRGEEASAATGRLVFTVGSQLVAELCQGDLLESWAAAEALSATEAAELTEAAATHLAEMLEDGLGAVDIAEAVTDAAVVFLLAMRRQGISDPKRIPACSVMWNGCGARERVLFSA